MYIPNLIRALLFLTAAILMLVYPKKVYKFSLKVTKKLKIPKKVVDMDRKLYLPVGMLFAVLSTILFYYAIIG